MIKQISTGVATATLLATIFAPMSAFADTIVITGNGANSTSTLTHTTQKNITITQSNSSDIAIGISSKAITGENETTGNTGGASAIQSGDAASTVGVQVLGSANLLTMPQCGCDTPHTITISGNGAGSTNTATIGKTKIVTKNQVNATGLTVLLDSLGKTGGNKNNGNTAGISTILSGLSTSITDVSVGGSSNNF